MPLPAPTFAALQTDVRRIAQETAAAHADDVDQRARFPRECIAALREARVLSAALPGDLGGSGCSLAEQGLLIGLLAQRCASSAMVLAMHFIQVACLARHAGGSAVLQDWLRGLAERQWLVASMTSEVGTFGETRTSVCAVEHPDGPAHFRLHKDATTGSYCAEADAILVTARRAHDAAAADQVLVLVLREHAGLEQIGTWDTLGMRGTCSPGFKLRAHGPSEHILPVPYADISAQSMVPTSHILWSALWHGIAAGAQARAAAFVRGQARKAPGTVPPAAAALADLTQQLQVLRHHWQGLAAEFDSIAAAGTDARDLAQIGWALKMNNLKIASSEAAPRLVHAALQIVGVAGYRNDGPYSMGRAYRDALSGSLMISNERIAAKNAAILLVFKDD